MVTPSWIAGLYHGLGLKQVERIANNEWIHIYLYIYVRLSSPTPYEKRKVWR
jgi:hypothetical protein